MTPMSGSARSFTPNAAAIASRSLSTASMTRPTLRVGRGIDLAEDLQQPPVAGPGDGRGEQATVELMEHVHVALTVGAGRVRQGAGLSDDDGAVLHGQTRGALEGQRAAARAGTDHDGHPG